MNQYVKSAEANVRAGFIRKVYTILSFQLLLTVAIATPIALKGMEYKHVVMPLVAVSIFGSLATICSIMCCRDTLRQYPTNYVILFIFTACEGVLVGYASMMYTWQSVLVAAGVTAFIFVALTLYACFTKTDFTGFGPYLFAFMLALVGMGFVISIFSLFGLSFKPLIMLYNFCGVLLFSFYIIFDTQLIMGGSHEVQFTIDDYCFASLSLYLDIINLFIHLLALLGERRN